MENFQIIALTGAAGSGKSTVAKYLERSFDGRIYSFASPLKLLLKELFEFSDTQLYGTQAQKEAIDPRYGFSARQAMQRMNVAKGLLGDDVYARALVGPLRAARASGVKLAVVDDLRFLVEADTLRAHFPGRVSVWRLENPDRESSADANHPSEIEWVKIPYDRAGSWRKGEHLHMYAEITRWMMEFR